MTNICECIGMSCCTLCAKICGTIVGILIVMVPLSITISSICRDRPILYLDGLHVSLVNKTLDSSTNTTLIHFNLTIVNPNMLYGLYYKDPLTLTFTYFPPSINNNTNVTIGRYTSQGFYQGLVEFKHIRDFVVVQDIFSEAKQLREPAKVALLSVDLDASVKFKSIEHTKYHLQARAFVEVNCNTGNVVLNKTVIPLDYISGSDEWNIAQWSIAISSCVIVSVIIIMFVTCVTRKPENTNPKTKIPRTTNPEITNPSTSDHHEPLLGTTNPEITNPSSSDHHEPLLS